MDLELFLKKVPLFSSIPDQQIREISDCFQLKEFKKDTFVFHQGDESDAMYVIRSGTIRIIDEKNVQTPVHIELQRGDFFGEMALLSNRPRSAGARVGLDAGLYCLQKDDFNSLLSRNRHIGLYLSRLYARRLSFGARSDFESPRQIFFTLSATDAELGLSHFLYSMSYHISTESNKKVLVVEPHLELESVMQKFGLHPVPCPDTGLFDMLPANLYTWDDVKWFAHPDGFNVLQLKKGFNERLDKILPHLMESLRQLFDMVIFSLGHHFGTLERQAIRLCDKNLLIINNTATALSDVKQKLTRLEQVAGIGLDRIRVGVSHLDGTIGIPRETLKKELNLSETPQIWVERSPKAINDQIDTEKRFPIRGARAIARELAGVRVGLALGAGAARGWSHIGVLKVLEQEGIHIDMIAGTSMGALVGAVFAATGSTDYLEHHMVKNVSTRQRARRKIFDLTLPLQGFLKGNKALNLVSDAINGADFMDLLIPTYLVGVDILKGEEILFETGDVARAVRSSLSLPVIFVPFRHKGRWMVDGGLLNPVPVNVLEQKGADKIIAVCVENPNTNTPPGSRPPNLFKVILRTISIVHGRATSGFAQKSDVVIYPKAQDFSWDDFHSGDILIKRGEAACMERIEDIRTMVGHSP